MSLLARKSIGREIDFSMTDMFIYVSLQLLQLSSLIRVPLRSVSCFSYCCFYFINHLSVQGGAGDAHAAFCPAPLITVWTVIPSRLDVCSPVKSRQMKGCAEWLWVSTPACDCERRRVTFNLLQFLQPVTLSWLHTHCGTLGHTLELGHLAGVHTHAGKTTRKVCVFNIRVAHMAQKQVSSPNHQC